MTQIPRDDLNWHLALQHHRPGSVAKVMQANVWHCLLRVHDHLEQASMVNPYTSQFALEC